MKSSKTIQKKFFYLKHRAHNCLQISLIFNHKSNVEIFIFIFVSKLINKHWRLQYKIHCMDLIYMLYSTRFDSNSPPKYASKTYFIIVFVNLEILEYFHTFLDYGESSLCRWRCPFGSLIRLFYFFVVMFPLHMNFKEIFDDLEPHVATIHSIIFFQFKTFIMHIKFYSIIV